MYCDRRIGLSSLESCNWNVTGCADLSTDPETSVSLVIKRIAGLIYKQSGDLPWKLLTKLECLSDKVKSQAEPTQ
jgi:hypothetical protein